MWGRWRSTSPGAWSPRRRMKATPWLVGAVFVLYVALLGIRDATGREALLEWVAASSEGLLAGRVWQLVTHQVLHPSVLQLGLHLLFLFLAGQIFESLMGARRLVGVLLGCGIVGGLAAFVEPGPVMGLSGGLFGLIVVLALTNPELVVNLFFFPIRLKWLAAIFLGIGLLSLIGPGEPVSPFSQLFGALAGGGYAWVWPRVVEPRIRALRRRRERRREVAAIERTVNEERELDRILDKISCEGMQSLTEEEQRFLRRTSRRYQGSKEG